MQGDGWSNVIDTAPMQGPNNWMRYTCPKTGNYYFHNPYKSVTTWDEPQEWRDFFGSPSGLPPSGGRPAQVNTMGK